MLRSVGSDQVGLWFILWGGFEPVHVATRPLCGPAHCVSVARITCSSQKDLTAPLLFVMQDFFQLIFSDELKKNNHMCWFTEAQTCDVKGPESTSLCVHCNHVWKLKADNSRHVCVVRSPPLTCAKVIYYSYRPHTHMLLNSFIHYI